MTTELSAQSTAGAKKMDRIESCPRPLAEEQQYRAEAYRLIAAMLRSCPDAELLEQISGLSQIDAPDELGLSMSMLGLAARSSTHEAVRNEYQQLFIGLGRGELVPYASWYLTGFLMEKPL